MVGLEEMLDYSGVKLQLLHCSTEIQHTQLRYFMGGGGGISNKNSTKTLLYNLLPAVPGAEPMNLTAVNIEAFYVSIQWEGLNFLDRNGPDFSYNVSYNVQGSSDGGSVAVNQNSTVIMGLKGFTTYEITVAGQNSVGLGPLSDPLTVTTLEGSEYI